MDKAIIYIYGIITSNQSMNGFFDGFTNLSIVRAQIDANEEAKELEVHIHSVGGDPNEGMAIYNALRQEAAKGKIITTIADGNVASSGTYPFLAGDKRLANKYVRPFIHEMQGGVEGSASKIKEYSDKINSMNNMLISFYSERLPKLTKDQISNLLKDNTFVESKDLVEMGFATGIQEVFEPQNIYKPNTINMNDKEKGVFESLQNQFNELKTEIKNLITGDGKNDNENKSTDPTNKVINAVTGEALNFPEVDENQSIKEGDIVNGQDVKDGSYILNDGAMTIDVLDGKVKKVTERVDKTELEAVNNKLTELTTAKNAEITALKDSNLTFKNSMTDKVNVMESEINKLKGSNTDINNMGGGNRDKVNKNPYKVDKFKFA